MRICGIGDNTIDEYVNQGRCFPGGNAVNVAVIARHHGAEAGYVGVTGSDARGELFRSGLRAEGIDISRVKIIDGPNAHCDVILTDGDRSFADFEPEPAPLRLDAVDLAYLSTFDVIHLGYAAQISTELATIAAGRYLSYDFGSRPDVEIDAVLPHLGAAVFSRSHLTIEQARAYAREVQNHGPSIVIVTMGERGAVVAANGRVHHQEIVPTTVIDTLGAGDAFFAAFIVAFTDNADLAAAARQGAEAAALTIGRLGAFGAGADLIPRGAAS